ncbi:MAG: branched-chain amino acid ABC transporter permease [Actinomycetota bacterium]|nr:branched-chain amino acid ABC transporter permease [Actinomycetota bacterium]
MTVGTRPDGSQRPALVDRRLATVIGIAVVTLPVLVLPELEGRLVTRVVAFAVILAGLNLLTGFGGQLTLGHGAAVGLGAVTTAVLVTNYQIHQLLALPIAAGVGLVGGLVMGLPALRIRGMYLALVTMTMAVAFPLAVKRYGWLTGGSNGKRIVPELTGPGWPVIGDDHVWVHLIVVAIAFPVLIAVANLVDSRPGRALRAVAANPTSATSTGVDGRAVTLQLFALASAVGAIGGSLLAFETPFVSADTYSVFLSFQLYAAVVVGGLAHRHGHWAGAVLFVAAPWVIEELGFVVEDTLVFGAVLLAVTFLLPGGVMSGMDHIVERFRTAPSSGDPGGRPAARPSVTRIVVDREGNVHEVAADHPRGAIAPPSVPGGWRTEPAENGEREHRDPFPPRVPPGW